MSCLLEFFKFLKPWSEVMSALDTIKVQLTNIETKVATLGGTTVTPPSSLNFDTLFPVLTSAQTAVTAVPVGSPVDPNIVPILADVTTRLNDIQAKVTALGSASVTGTVTGAQVLAAVADLLTKSAALSSTGSGGTNAVTALTAVQAQIVGVQTSVNSMVGTSGGTGGTGSTDPRIITALNTLLTQVGQPTV